MAKKIWIIAFVLILLSLVSYGILRWWKRPLYSSFSRGKDLASRLGCFGCHGPEGTAGIANPGPEEENVPSWDGGTMMMYAKNDEEIREWILDGMTKKMSQDPEELEETRKALIQMPAYRDKISKGELEDLLTYVKAVSWADEISEPLARKGRETAFEKGCFGCHGPEGKSPTFNPGSLKGYIPPWDSADFNELVKDDQELDEWILKGVTQRFQNNSLALFFLSRQKLYMPAYKKHLTPEELAEIKTYIIWVRKLGVQEK